MLSRNPDDRYQSIKDVLDHPFFALTNVAAAAHAVKLPVDDGVAAALQKKIDEMQAELEASKQEAARVNELEMQLKRAVKIKRDSITRNEDQEAQKKAQEDFLNLKQELRLAKEKAEKVTQLEKELEERKNNPDASSMMAEMIKMQKTSMEMQKQGQTNAEAESARIMSEMK